MAAIELRNISKSYPDGTKAISGISLSIKQGDFLVLIGPSGCGKTTLLRMISGLIQPTSGSILMDDVPVNDVPAKNRNLAMVFQNYTLFPYMTVFKNIAFPLTIRREEESEVKRKVEQAACLLNIQHLLQKKPKELSGGEKQRVALGRAIVREPRAFLYDEPFSNLDIKLRTLMRAEIRKIHKALQTTTIYVTHDRDEAMTMGNRIAVLNNGRIEQEGDPSAVYYNPQTLFAAEFSGDVITFQVDVQADKSGLSVSNIIAEDNSYPLFSIDKMSHHSSYQRFLPYLGRNCSLAFRPDGVYLSQEAYDKNNPAIRQASLKCLNVEQHTNIRYYTFTHPGIEGLSQNFEKNSFTIKTGAVNNIAAGDLVQAGFDIDKALLFPVLP